MTLFRQDLQNENKRSSKFTQCKSKNICGVQLLRDYGAARSTTMANFGISLVGSVRQLYESVMSCNGKANNTAYGCNCAKQENDVAKFICTMKHLTRFPRSAQNGTTKKQKGKPTQRNSIRHLFEELVKNSHLQDTLDWHGFSSASQRDDIWFSI